MTCVQGKRASRHFLTHIVLPVAATVAAVAAIVALLLVWSTRQVDHAAQARQQRLVALIVHDSIAALAHDQEASTVWDDAVLQLRRRPIDPAWLDANLGVWFYTYYGHDRVYIVDPRGRPIYAMQDGRRAPAERLATLHGAATPLLRALRAKLRDPHTPLGPAVRSPGAADLAVIDGRPAIVSVKPIIPDTDKLVQAPDAAYLHISIRFLDGSFMARLARQYMFDGARFSWSPTMRRDEMSLPFRANDGHAIGYMTWRPFVPGSRVMGQLGPVLAVGLLLVGGIVALLMLRIRRSGAQLQASEAQAHHLAYHDVLTGLPNRARFEDGLNHELARVRRGNTGLALLYLDLDRLKHVNDTLGHPAGDALIAELGQRLRRLVREADLVARLGGDEFAIVQTDVKSAAATEILCLRIVEEIGRPFDVLGNQVHVGISVGVALAPADGLDRVELSRKADIALYHSKTHGRGRYTAFSEDMDSTIQTRQSIVKALREALAAGDQLAVHYQPVYAARTRRMSGIEALVRWNHPEKGLLSPAMFIPIAEESGLIEPLGAWVLREACTAARNWAVDKLSVNISAVQLRNPAFGVGVLAICDETGLDPARLELEITETCFIENAAAIQPNIATLRSAGVQIALDDFGTGYSSLSHLREFDVDRVKIDRSFVSSIDRPDGGSAIIQAIVHLAQATGLQVTAEGVETSEQSLFLSGIGCDELQGFLLSRPLPASGIEALLEAIGAGART